jgi:hypothetical protein
MKRTVSEDPRTQSQKTVDEAIAVGDWSGFETESLLTEEGAYQILQHCHNLAKEMEMDQAVALGGVRGQPFRWKDRVYRIMRSDYVGGEALVEVVPHDPEFVAVLKKRIEDDRFHTLTYYQGFGFVCFPEDYQKYQD